MLRQYNFRRALVRLAPLFLFSLLMINCSISGYCAEEAESLYQQAVKARAEGNLAESAALLEQALSEHPDDIETIKLYAVVLSQLKRFDESFKWFTKAYRLNPGDVEAALGLARVASWQGRYDEAIRAYMAILKAHPEAVEAYLALGSVWSWKGDYDKAIEYAQTYVERCPDDPEGYVLLGRMYKRKQEYQKSQEYYSQALALDPTNEEATKGVEKPSQPKRFRLDTGYSNTAINRRGDWNSENLQLSYEPDTLTTLVGRVERNERNGAEDIFYGVEVYRDLTEKLNLHLGYGFTPDSDFSPKTAILSEVSYPLPYANSIVLGYSRLNFPDGAVDMVTAEIYHYFGDEAYVSAKYYRTFHFSGKETNSYVVRGNYDITDSVILRGGAAHGAEATDILSTGAADVINVDSFFGGVVLRLSENCGVSLDYTFENRDNGFEHHTVSAGYYVKF